MKRNRLKITMESRIHGDVYVRFGGERLETYRPKGRQGALRLACGVTVSNAFAYDGEDEITPIIDETELSKKIESQIR